MNATLPSELRDVPRETLDKLESYVHLLLKWNAKINLIGPATEKDIWARHIADSWQLLPLIEKNAVNLVDFGSGAGLPGMVISIARPDLRITLVEQDQRKAAFLSEAKRVLLLENLDVRAIHIKNLEGIFDVISARALAPLNELFSLSIPHLGEKSICLFPKGENFATELEQAGENWVFEHKLTPSKTHEKACIVSVSQLKRR